MLKSLEIIFTIWATSGIVTTVVQTFNYIIASIRSGCAWPYFSQTDKRKQQRERSLVADEQILIRHVTSHLDYTLTADDVRSHRLWGWVVSEYPFCKEAYSVLTVYTSTLKESERVLLIGTFRILWFGFAGWIFKPLPYIVTDSVLVPDYFPFQQRGICYTSDTPLCIFIEPTY